MNLHLKNITILTAAIACVAACAPKPVVMKEEVGESSPATGEMIMTQVGSSVPVISSSDEKHWIQLKNSKDSSRNKLYGMLATGDWQPAVEEARLQLEKRPGDPAMIVALAAAYASGRNYEMAGYYGKLALKTDQSNADAMNLVGLRVMMSAGNRRNDFDDALAWFRKATDNDGTNVAAPSIWVICNLILATLHRRWKVSDLPPTDAVVAIPRDMATASRPPAWVPGHRQNPPLREYCPGRLTAPTRNISWLLSINQD